tara:strand:+ start:184 stop:1044 length:861 start_codon:yes stop_codon:yes gene_type:complete
MPELPEVEIVKQSVERSILFQKINDVLIKNRKLRFKIQNNFKSLLKNKKIIKVSRKFKYLIIHFEKEEFLIIHFGMSGTLHLLNKNNHDYTNLSFYSSRRLPKKHNHVIIIFPNFKLVYNDPRRFGFFKFLFSKKQLNFFFKNYGPEPLSSKFDLNYLKIKLKNKKKNIKNLLLDQTFVSGIGNIYANEILFYSKINPEKNGKKLKINEIKNIIKFSKIVLNKAIKRGGSSIKNFKNIKGLSGTFQKEFKVYERENKNCLKRNCRGIIKRIIISNRSTFLCNYCQK